VAGISPRVYQTRKRACVRVESGSRDRSRRGKKGRLVSRVCVREQVRCGCASRCVALLWQVSLGGRDVQRRFAGIRVERQEPPAARRHPAFFTLPVLSPHRPAFHAARFHRFTSTVSRLFVFAAAVCFAARPVAVTCRHSRPCQPPARLPRQQPCCCAAMPAQN